MQNFRSLKAVRERERESNTLEANFAFVCYAGNKKIGL